MTRLTVGQRGTGVDRSAAIFPEIEGYLAAPPPRCSAVSIAERLRLLGLRDVDRILTHSNRTVMVSLSARRVLRLHQGYAFASDRVLRAIVRFLNSRLPRAVRRAAEREFLSFPVEQYVPSSPRAARMERPRPGDLRLLHRLRQAHDRLNAQHFGGTLSEIPIRLSGRMRTRLGELSVDLRTGQALEIALSRLHLARHPWHEVEHTLLHEMVHQWQAESGLRVDHGRSFRGKAAEVGVLPQAKRSVSKNTQVVDGPPLASPLPGWYRT